MEDVLIILGAVLSLAVIVLIGLYNHLDRLRFHMDRLLAGAADGLDAWVACCEALSPGCGEAYHAAKKNWARTACLRDLAEGVRGSSEAKLSAQIELLEFCHRYNDLAERFNRWLDAPLAGRLAARLGFRPYAPLDFYPDVPRPQVKQEPEA